MFLNDNILFCLPNLLQDDHAHAAASQAELGLANVGGVFVVLVLGCTAGFFMAVMEFLWNIRKIAVEEQVNAMHNK